MKNPTNKESLDVIQPLKINNYRNTLWNTNR